MSDVRASISRHLEEHPGVHVSALVRDLGLAPGQVQYHLDALRGRDAVVAERFRGRTHYYPPDIPATHRRSIAVLRRETARDIVVTLIESGPSRPGDVTDAIGIARGTLEYHVEALTAEGLVEKHRSIDGAVTLYVPTPERTLELVATTSPATTDRLIDRFTRLVDILLEGQS